MTATGPASEDQTWEQLATALEVAGPMSPTLEARLRGELMPVIDHIAARRAAEAEATIERVRNVLDALETPSTEAERDGCRATVDARTVARVLRRALDPEPTARTAGGREAGE